MIATCVGLKISGRLPIASPNASPSATAPATSRKTVLIRASFCPARTRSARSTGTPACSMSANWIYTSARRRAGNPRRRSPTRCRFSAIFTGTSERPSNSESTACSLAPVSTPIVRFP